MEIGMRSVWKSKRALQNVNWWLFVHQRGHFEADGYFANVVWYAYMQIHMLMHLCLCKNFSSSSFFSILFHFFCLSACLFCLKLLSLLFFMSFSRSLPSCISLHWGEIHTHSLYPIHHLNNFAVCSDLFTQCNFLSLYYIYLFICIMRCSATRPSVSTDLRL